MNSEPSPEQLQQIMRDACRRASCPRCGKNPRPEWIEDVDSNPGLHVLSVRCGACGKRYPVRIVGIALPIMGGVPAPTAAPAPPPVSFEASDKQLLGSAMGFDDLFGSST